MSVIAISELNRNLDLFCSPSQLTVWVALWLINGSATSIRFFLVPLLPGWRSGYSICLNTTDITETHIFRDVNQGSHLPLLCVYMCCSVAQLCPTLWDPMDYSPPGSFVHGIFPARILEWAVIFYSRGLFRPRDGTWVSFISCISKFFTTVPPGKCSPYPTLCKPEKARLQWMQSPQTLSPLT